MLAAVSDAFADRLIRRVREIGHPLCVGLDPHLPQLPASFRRGSMAPGAPETAEAVEAFCLAALDRVVGRVAAVKPQAAFFEQLGPPGAAVLGRVVAEARARDLLVILDAKRGDIGSTAEGYARAYLAKDAPLRADALTVNPWLGLDTLEPFIQAAEASGAGLFVLVKTSNPGSGDLQDRLVGERRVWEVLADELAPLAARLRGPATEWSSLGVVVGATYPEESERVRELLPSSPFLVPGYGAQGGGATAALAGFVPGPGGRLEGGLVNSARAILFPDGGEAGGHAWEEAFDAALARAADELGRAAG
jgi:orotidine-5'-phosphate decarboxylase